MPSLTAYKLKCFFFLNYNWDNYNFCFWVKKTENTPDLMK